MSKKTRRKFPAKPSQNESLKTKRPKKAPKRASKTDRGANLKTSKRVSVKKSSPKARSKTTAAAGTNETVDGTSSKAARLPQKTAATKVLTEGAAAPDFDLPRDGGGHLSLKDFAGRKLVLFFYPRADTPGCTREAMDFSRLLKDFASNGADVVGISSDSPKAQESFQNKHQLKTPLISDERREMIEGYGAWGEKSMYGRRFLGILRTTILVGRDGTILRMWRNVKVEGHAAEVLAAVRSL